MQASARLFAPDAMQWCAGSSPRSRQLLRLLLAYGFHLLLATAAQTMRKLRSLPLDAFDSWKVEKPGEKRRRCYKLTKEGKQVLKAQRSLWQSFVAAINQVTGLENA